MKDLFTRPMDKSYHPKYCFSDRPMISLRIDFFKAGKRRLYRESSDWKYYVCAAWMMYAHAGNTHCLAARILWWSNILHCVTIFSAISWIFPNFLVLSQSVPWNVLDIFAEHVVTPIQWRPNPLPTLAIFKNFFWQLSFNYSHGQKSYAMLITLNTPLKPCHYNEQKNSFYKLILRICLVQSSDIFPANPV